MRGLRGSLGVPPCPAGRIGAGLFVSLLLSVTCTAVRAADPPSAVTHPPSPAPLVPGAVAPARPVDSLGPAPGAARSAGVQWVDASARYRSVARPETPLYSAPSLQAQREFAAPAGMPVRVLAAIPGWFKVQDYAGDVTWVGAQDLSTQRTVLLTAPTPLLAAPRGEPAADGELDAGAVLTLLDPKPEGGFISVRAGTDEASAVKGYVPAALLWGL